MNTGRYQRPVFDSEEVAETVGVSGSQAFINSAARCTDLMMLM